MSSKQTTNSQAIGRAEAAFRDAFDRLKRNEPNRLEKGVPLSQNNVAKEAGCDPSALKKSRFPSLIAEIQAWISECASDRGPSGRQTRLAQRGTKRTLEEKIKIVEMQRDQALSLLVEADAKILELAMEVTKLKDALPQSNVTPIGKKF